MLSRFLNYIREGFFIFSNMNIRWGEEGQKDIENRFPIVFVIYYISLLVFLHEVLYHFFSLTRHRLTLWQAVLIVIIIGYSYIKFFKSIFGKYLSKDPVDLDQPKLERQKKVGATIAVFLGGMLFYHVTNYLIHVIRLNFEPF